MKKVLLGSTALVAVGLLAGPAFAQLEFSLSGSVDVHAGFSSEDLDVDRRAYGITTDTTLNFDADGVADNGLEYGSRINVDDSGDDFEIDETWVYVSGSFGEMRFGATDPVASELRFSIPTVGNGQTDGDFGRYVNDENNSFVFGVDFEYSGDDNKIAYIGEFGDITVGASFSPTSESNKSDPAQGENDTVIDIDLTTPGVIIFELDFALEDIISIGGNYQGEFGGVAFGVSGGANFADVQAGTINIGGVGVATLPSDDFTEYGAGVEVGFGAITGGGFWITSEIDDLDIDIDKYGAGATFTTGPWGFGASVLLAELDLGGGAEIEDTIYGVGVEYSMADGLTPYADLVFFDHEALDPAFDNDGSVFLVGMTASF